MDWTWPSIRVTETFRDKGCNLPVHNLLVSTNTHTHPRLCLSSLSLADRREVKVQSGFSLAVGLVNGRHRIVSAAQG
ncbi:unnamed protein product [Nezara viridula]|uniref:Uncharacterized protein n=1 Tax=Nezara viridula TaxID=85310 RepID=A0A9P0MZ13_NEZVI|nr:unnamed protein product [Nezara viridula]